MSEIGHNSAGDNPLRQFIERVERVEEEEKGIRDDKKDIFAEAKSEGYDTKIMRPISVSRYIRRSHSLPS